MSTLVIDSNTPVQAAFEAQLAYLKSMNGSRAIAAGRAAGLAWEAGHANVAQAIWSKEVAQVAGMPSLAEFRAGYEKHPDAFAEFASAKHFPAGGTAFSNATGSYAYLLENATRGQAALVGGEAEWVAQWGAKALIAADFPEKAALLKQVIATDARLETGAIKSV